MHASKCLKTGISAVALLVTFFFTGWVLNWAPLSNMLDGSGFYASLCDNGSVGCHEQQVAIAKLQSAIMLSEFTIFPSGVLMDLIGPILFTVFAGILHCGSTIMVLAMPKDSPLLVVPFFGCGAAAHAAALLGMRTVFIFDTPIGRSRWILACCTVFDSSAICTMIYYNLWENQLISIDNVFKSLAIIGVVLFGLLSVLYLGFKYYSRVKTESDTLKEPLTGGDVESVEGKKKLTLSEIISSPVFYFMVFYSAVSIFRIRYFLGVANYSLKGLHDNGFYLQALGYCFCLTALFTPIADRILRYLDNAWLRFHLVNVLITAYILVWLVPILPVQLVTFALFVLARLMFFCVLNDFCSAEFTEQWFGMIMGLGFVAAAIPGSFTYVIVDVALKKFDSNFYVFHLMCILLAIPTFIAICLLKKYDDGEKERNSILEEDESLNWSSTISSSGVPV